jgi:hypothetical protein
MSIIIPGEPTPEENAPVDEKGNPMLRFEVKMRKHKGGIQKAIFIGGEMLDWSVDVSQMIDAMNMGPHFYKEVQRDIERHFVESVSEFIGRKVGPTEIKKAIKEGWI